MSEGCATNTMCATFDMNPGEVFTCCQTLEDDNEDSCKNQCPKFGSHASKRCNTGLECTKADLPNGACCVEDSSSRAACSNCKFSYKYASGDQCPEEKACRDNGSTEHADLLNDLACCKFSPTLTSPLENASDTEVKLHQSHPPDSCLKCWKGGAAAVHKDFCPNGMRCDMRAVNDPTLPSNLFSATIEQLIATRNQLTLKFKNVTNETWAEGIDKNYKGYKENYDTYMTAAEAAQSGVLWCLLGGV